MDKLFLTILNMSITGSAVIAVICIVRLLLKRAPKIITYLLWGIAGLRLVLPFSIESLFSLIPFKPQPIPVDIALEQIPRVDSGMVIVDNIINNTLPAPLVGDSVNPLQIWIAIGTYAWLIGAVILVAYAIISYLVLKTKMRGANCIKENIYESQNVQSPFVLGFFSPKIYLPAGLSEKEITFIISHEKAHIKRCDHIIKFAAYLVLCLHWFNPLVWVAFYLMGKDMEMSCDERVLKELGAEIKSDYSRTLLSLAVKRYSIGGSPLAFGETGVKMRIKNVLAYKKPVFWVIILAVVTAVVVCVCLITSPKAASTDTDRVYGGNSVSSDILTSPDGVITDIHFMNGIDLPNDYHVYLVMKKGRSFSGEEEGYGGGIYDTNFMGEYELVVYKGTDGMSIASKIESSVLLPLSFDGKYLNFPEDASLNAADYNGDGNIDFALGQWASSGENAFMLFTVDKNGIISQLNTSESPFIVSNKEFSPVFEKLSDVSFKLPRYSNATGETTEFLASWDGGKFVITQKENSKVSLTAANAKDFINQTLSTFKLNSDNTVSFTLPQAIPVSEDGKTKLIISSSATFSSEPGSHSVQEILDWREGWQGGEAYIQKLEMSRGRLTRLFLRVAFMTEEGENSYREYAANYIELTEPFEYDTPVNVVDSKVEVSQTGTSGVLKYTMQNGDNFSVNLTLPKGVTLSAGESSQATDNYMPEVMIAKDGNPIGSLTLFGFGDDKEGLTQTDTAENTLPMQIFSPIALSNHAQFDNYKVCKSSATGANATADYLWQDLTDYGGRAPDAPWLKANSILAYDYEKMPFFIYMNLTDGSLSAAELENLAKSINIVN